MLLKRYIPIGIVAFFGSLTLFGWFIENESIESFVNDDATQWYDIIASFAIFLGALNLLKLQFLKVVKRQSGWQYSVVAIASFFFAFTIGFFMKGAFFVGEDVYFTQKAAEQAILVSGSSEAVRAVEWGPHISTEGGLFKWMFDSIFTPLSATMFALLAFYVASASYRAFRARNFEATLLLLAGIIIMLGRVPVGSLITPWMVMYLLVFVGTIFMNTYFKDRKLIFGSFVLGLLGVTTLGMSMDWNPTQPAIFFLPSLQEWIYTVPNLAGARAIMIGIGLGIIVTSLRYIFGLEKSYIGDQ
ncbi:MAG TPA: hypothetical protein EYQ76_04030 [Candidatus Marinimicrobia bacterium]|jgi:hypothetical protein|nr:hypothetical protein [Candidatus Neomarinimicrobiota bacterium]HIL86403.1 hypothetical protein [Candidatus Neomarinimicrobiota bacterium]